MTEIFIKNYDQLLSKYVPQNHKKSRKIALNSLEKAINSIKPDQLIEKAIKVDNNNLEIHRDLFNLNNYKRIYIIGGGKATAEMAFALEKKIRNYSDLDYKGIINIPIGLDIKDSDFLGNIKINFASHPIPDENSLKGTRSMMKIIEKSSRNDLIFCLISGGGSALLTLPKEGISLADLQLVNSFLLASGASIHEINTIRKHLSDFKGGNLVKKLFEYSKATLICLIISDVIGNNLDSIASGPTVPDSTTYQEAYEILNKYNLIERIPSSVKKVLERGLNDPKLENPKVGDIIFNNIHNYLIGSVESAVQEVVNYLKKLDFKIYYFSNQIKGEARDYGKILYKRISETISDSKSLKLSQQIALIGTGELTVTLKGDGIGGRNQEMLLSFLDIIKDKDISYEFTILAANLDGIEGNSQAMGALVDNFILNQILLKKINVNEFLNNNDSNSLFKMLNSEIITGPTGCNVNDLILALISI